MATITDVVFSETYKPKTNHLDDNASWDGCMYETYGEELEYVKMVDAETLNKVWTILDCDGALIVSSGYQHVNRVGYLITEVPYPEGETIEVIDEEGIE